MNKTGWRLLFIGVVSYLVFLLIGMPAALVWSVAESRVTDVELSSIQGTLWSGEAATLQSGKIKAQNVRWKFQPSALLLGRVQFAVEGKTGGGFVQANAGRGMLLAPYLKDVVGEVDANDVRYWLGLNKLKVDGRFEFELDSVSWSGSRVSEVQGDVKWVSAEILSPLQLSLGEATLAVSMQGPDLNGQLQTSGGDLVANGVAVVEPSGAYRFDADVQQKGNVPQAVSTFLSTFAEFKNGTYKLEWADSL